MATDQSTSIPVTGLPARQVYAIAAISLSIGLAIGYTFLGNRTPSASPPPQQPPTSSASATATPGNHPKLTLEQMKQFADVQASTLVEKSKSDPGNVQLLLQIAAIYQSSHQFKEGADFYDRALKIDPKNAGARTQLASCLYYAGDVDGALEQLNRVLKTSPKDTNALFNLGMIRYRGKNDNAGAIAAWQQLLKANPNLDRKPMVEQLIAEAKSAPVEKN